MDLNLRGKIAVVTGASKGIGLAITKGLVAEGARVMLARATSVVTRRTGITRSGSRGVNRSFRA